jgi:hypothetical protein
MPIATDPPRPPGAELPDLFRVPTEAAPPARIVHGLVIASIWFALGVVGWLVPVMTGIPFYIAGTVALALVSRRVRRLINRWDRGRTPRTRLRLRRALRKVPGRGLQQILVPFDDSGRSGQEPPGGRTRASE